MSKATNGSQMLLDEALRLVDLDGEPIKWEKQEDGNYSGKKERKGAKVKDAEGKDKQLPGATYIYSITLRPQIVDVGVIEHVEGSTAEGPLTGDEAKKADKAAEEQAKKSQVQTEEVNKQAEIEESVESHNSKSSKSKKF